MCRPRLAPKVSLAHGKRGIWEHFAIKVPFKQTFLRATIYAIKTLPGSILRRRFFEEPFSKSFFLRQTVLQSSILSRPYFCRRVLWSESMKSTRSGMLWDKFVIFKICKTTKHTFSNVHLFYGHWLLKKHFFTESYRQTHHSNFLKETY